ncbi:hypothetical protein F5B22DRAFT_608888 [Xylaria bambusicola]|uniref:uncharacterized protein n=1 Tax=Xylaria bambusicola TaxID=326684 RepID=UPI0020076B80|nr:uncharacterized protein F5B22DRAFT_608888 [Xylaria bambusicola]KAI0514909.1 hypothetical protein F5B22DRAFT_608888 [Xylaria bambusicola]
MYKARFQQWEIEKKIKAEDAVEIFRQQTARANVGKPSVVYIRGRKISPDRLQRYRYRAAAMVLEQILVVEKGTNTSRTTMAPESSHIICRTPSPTPEASPSLSPQLDDPTDFKVPHDCMNILRGYITGSVEAGAWRITPTAPVPDAFTWAHYIATSQGLIAHNRTREGFDLLNLCLEQYKSHLRNPDPFFWLATYKAALLLGSRNTQMGDMFIKYASELTSILLPPSHPFNRVWSRIKLTGLQGLQQHATALFESYLSVWKEQVGLLPNDQNSLVQMAFVFIQLQCSGMLSHPFGREALAAMMAALSNSVSGQFLLQEARFRMACLFLEQGRLSEADTWIGQIFEWIDSVQDSSGDEFDHLRCKCLWILFEIKDREGDIDQATQIGRSLVDFCYAVYGPTHLQTIDAISALESFYTRNNNHSAAQEVGSWFNECWDIFSAAAQKTQGFPHTIQQPWLHRCIELEEDQRLIQQVVDLLEQSSWLEES